MKTKASCLLHKPPGVSFDAAALTEPLSGAWKGLIQKSEMQLGDDVVINVRGNLNLEAPVYRNIALPLFATLGLLSSAASARGALDRATLRSTG